MNGPVRGLLCIAGIVAAWYLGRLLGYVMGTAWAWWKEWWEYGRFVK